MSEKWPKVGDILWKSNLTFWATSAFSSVIVLDGAFLRCIALRYYIAITVICHITQWAEKVLWCSVDLVSVRWAATVRGNAQPQLHSRSCLLSCDCRRVELVSARRSRCIRCSVVFCCYTVTMHDMGKGSMRSATKSREISQCLQQIGHPYISALYMFITFIYVVKLVTVWQKSL